MKWFTQDPLSQVSIKYKLPLTFVLLCLVAFGIGGYLVFNSVFHSIETEIQTRLRSEAYTHATVLDTKFETLCRRTEDFASDGYIRTLTASLNTDYLAADKKALHHHLIQNKLPLEAAFTGLTILNRNGKILVQSGKTSLQLARDYHNVTDSVSTQIITSGAEMAIAVATPVWNIEHTRVIGSLLSTINITSLLNTTAAEFNKAIQESMGSRYLTVYNNMDGELHIPWVLSSQNKVLSESDPSSETQPAHFSDHVGNHECEHGRTMFGQSYPLQNSGWNVLVELDAASAFGAVNSLEGKFLGAGILIALTTLVLLYFPVRFVIRPLDALKNMALQIKDGDFSVRLNNESADEIGHLARTFNHMAQAIEERTQHLEKTAEDLRRREEELRLEHHRLDTLVRSMQDGLVLLDHSGEIVLANKAADPLIRILNQEAVEFMTSQCPESGSNDNCLRCLRRKPGSHTCILRTDDTIFEILSMQLPGLQYEAGKVLVARDITEREQMRERQSHQERLTVLGKLAAVVAHELNSPLSAISMYNQMMQQELESDSPFHEHTEVIQRNTQSCQKIIKELLDYARTPQPKIDQIKLRQLVQDVLRFLKPIYEQKQIQFEIACNTPDMVVRGDQVQLQQVVVNLVMNAVQALPEEEGRIKITLEKRKSGYCLEVEDNGTGIPQEHIDEIFEPFFTTKSSGGTGLGLPTAKRIIRAHGGQLLLKRTDGDGTIFQIVLPNSVASDNRISIDEDNKENPSNFNGMNAGEYYVNTTIL